MSTPDQTSSPSSPTLLYFLAGAVIAALTLGAAGLALADGPILHEFFVIPQRDRAPAADERGDADASASRELSEALSDRDEGDDRDPGPPPLTIENRGEELEIDADGDMLTPTGEEPSDHNGSLKAANSTRPDRNTTLDSTLTYYSVFNPSVAPWKRVSARNTVFRDYSLGVTPSTRYKLKVQDKPVRSGHERFWGSVLVRMKRGEQVPLPSVAPRANILRYQTEPPTYLEFYRDMSDNYYVSGNTDGVVRINYLMETPSTYFGAEISEAIRVSDLSPAMRPNLPPNVQSAAEQAIEAIGVDREAPFREQLHTLVEYFRSFESQKFPEEERSQDIYLDLTLNKLGVCRHRAFAFVVTAQALDILARYVNNEAHAFVEVMVPGRGWMRIDLGGAATDFEMRNSNDKTLHTPSEADALPSPENYTGSYSHRLGRGEREADVNGDGLSEPLNGVPEKTTGAPELGPGDVPQGGGEGLPDRQSGSPEDVDTAPLEFPGDDDRAPQPAPTQERRATSLTILHAAKNAYRGDEFKIRAQLTTDQGLPLKDKEVEAFLVPKGDHKPDAFHRLGASTTDSSGEVRMEVEIPRTIPLGRWSLYLYFRGDGAFTSSHSR